VSLGVGFGIRHTGRGGLLKRSYAMPPEGGIKEQKERGIFEAGLREGGRIKLDNACPMHPRLF